MRAIFIVLLATLASCQTPERTAARKARVDAAEDSQCKSWGAKPGTPDYLHCRENLNAQDNARRQAALAFLASRQTPMPQPYYLPVPTVPNSTYTVPRHTSCNSMVIGSGISTNCY